MTHTRGFRLHTADGRTLDGAAFPSDRAVIDDPERGLEAAVATLEALDDVFPGHRIEWADGPGAGA